MASSELSLVFASDDLPDLRDRLRDWLTSAGARNGERDDIVLACWEAAVNAIEHPINADGQVHVVAERRDDTILVSVTDRGVWRDRHGRRSERGFGLKLISALVDRVEVVRTHTGTRVIMCRSLTAPQRS